MQPSMRMVLVKKRVEKVIEKINNTRMSKINQKNPEKEKEATTRKIAVV